MRATYVAQYRPWRNHNALLWVYRCIFHELHIADVATPRTSIFDLISPSVFHDMVFASGNAVRVVVQTSPAFVSVCVLRRLKRNVL